MFNVYNTSLHDFGLTPGGKQNLSSNLLTDLFLEI